MPLAHNGLVKLMEECGELTQIAAKMVAYPDTDEHPDGKGSMRARLIEEMGDTLAAITVTYEALALDRSAIAARREYKLGLFRQWRDEGGVTVRLRALGYHDGKGRLVVDTADTDESRIWAVMSGWDTPEGIEERKRDGANVQLVTVEYVK